jgi:pSer/pThr/pTyr-binding forkhead associated (FHA) protein
MSRLSLGRIAMMALGGAAGGLVTYCLLEPTLRAVEIANEARQNSSMAEDVAGAFSHAMLLGAVLSLTVGGALILVEELKSRSPIRIARLLLIGVVVGAMFGTIGGVAGQLLFSILVPLAMMSQSMAVLMLARGIGWSLMGAGAGLCPGVVMRSGLRIRQGILGGLIGGGLGGLLFDLLSQRSENGNFSRAVGFLLIGAAVGGLVSLIEETAKTHWLTVLTGAKEGRSFILSRQVTLLGRDELTDIPLFGDVSVQKRHALLTLTPNAVMAMAEPGAAMTINGQPATTQTPLADGDVLGIGRHRLLFRSRQTARPPVMVSSTEYRAGPLLAPEPVSMFPLPVPQGGTSPLAPLSDPGSSMSRIEVIAGPHMGAVFPLLPGAILGRDPRCDISLFNDAHASRQHARLIPEGTAWRIEDGGSVNGLYVNGQRVSGALLQPGDQIGVGNSILRIS